MRLKARWVLVKRVIKKRWNYLFYPAHRHYMRGRPGPAYVAKHGTPQ
jgi:hypothetical protein